MYIIIICLICNCFAQDYNPCKDKRFLFLSKIELDDMSDRQYNYYIKKEEECSKYKTRKSISRIKSKNIKKNKKYMDSAKTNSYTASVYSSLPLVRLNMVSGYEQVSINGFKLETPISFKIGRSIAYLKFELRNYIFSNDNMDNKEFGGNAILVTFLSEFGTLPLLGSECEGDCVSISVSQSTASSKLEVECAGSGICDHDSGECKCFSGFASSNGFAEKGYRLDCGYPIQYMT